MFRLTMLIHLLLCVYCRNVGAAETIYDGTWTGTIGKNRVQVCFTNENSQYYYLKHKVGIILERKETNLNGWQEKIRNSKTLDWQVTGEWNFDQITNNRLHGVWLDASGQKQEVIDLKRLAPAIEYGCASVFYRPIENGLSYRYGTMQFKGTSYKTIETASGTAFEVPNSIKNADKINAFIKDWIKEQASASYDCQINGGGGWSKTLEAVFLTKQWLVLSDILPDTFCGGAHGNWLIDHHTFNLTTGKKIKIWTWLKSGLENPSDNNKSKFRTLIEKLNPRDDCDNTFSLAEPYPTEKGLVFGTVYSHAERACSDDILVTYKQLQPYLSPQGRAAIKTVTRN